MDTIFALASGQGKSGVAVVRISGSRAREAVSTLCRLPEKANQAALRSLTFEGALIDKALVLAFAAPNSFTGEDVVELHLHGSTSIVSAVLKVLGGLDGLRIAEAGEFTRRALENDKLDLAQVEGLSDLIDAETEAQRLQAMRVFSGQLGDACERWRQQLIRAASLLEATIDFVDEDVPIDVLPEVKNLIDAVTSDLEHEVQGQKVAERVREGFEVAIIGAPNVGKSTLLNALAGRDAAIVSDIAGTTRDVIEVRMDLAGIPVTFLDTAGLRETTDTIETIGIERAVVRAKDADLRIFLKSARSDLSSVELEPDDLSFVAKADVVADGDISAVSGQGIQNLVDSVSTILGERAARSGLAIRERHRVAMQDSLDALGIAKDRISSSSEFTEVIAEDLRVAIRALDALVGRVDVEDLLGEIFSRFCIGK